MPQMPWFRSATRVSIIKNTSAQFIGRIISSLCTVVLTFYIARLFGSEGYGEFVKITTFVSFFYLLADFGFNAIYIQRSSLSPIRSEKIYDPQWSMLLVIRIVLSSLLTLVAVLILLGIPSSNSSNGYTYLVHSGIILLLPTIVFQALITTMNGLFQKLLRYELSAISVICGSVSYLLMIFLLVRNQSSSLVLFSILPIIVGSAVTTLVSFIFVRLLRSTTRIEKNISLYVPFLYSTIPLGMTLLFNVVYFHIDSIVMTFSRPTSEVGIYGLAYKVFELLLVFPTFFMNAIYPMLVTAIFNTKDKSKQEYIGLIKKSSIVLILSSLILVVITWFAAPYITLIKYDFIQSVIALRILLIGIPFFFLSSLMMWILISLNKQWTLAKIYGSSMVLNVVLNILLVPTFGYTAAAWITVCSEAGILLASGAVVIHLLRVMNHES